MREEHRLRALQVRVPGHVDVLGRLRALEQHPLESMHVRDDVGALAPDEQTERGRDLVVARPPGVELGARIAGELGHPPFDGGVDVLVGRRELERTVGELLLRPVECREHRGGLVGGEDVGAREPGDVRARTREVVGRETPVEREALGEREQLVGGAVGEPTVPEGHADPGPDVEVEGPPCSRAHVSTDRPHKRTKPEESSWRNVSDAS